MDRDRARPWLNTPEVRAARRRRELARLRRRQTRRRRALAGLVVVALTAVLLLVNDAPLELPDGAPNGGRSPVQASQAAPSVLPRPGARPASVLPTRAQIARARRFARRRAGAVSYAVVDTRGRLRCHECRRRYVSASLAKAMVMVAYLDRLDAEGATLSSSDSWLLRAMIEASDNDAATAIYRRVGNVGLYRVAKRARMRDFDVYGHWANARLTAADQARFFVRIDRLAPPPFRRHARTLLSSISRAQSWGIPQVARPRWHTFFKGGWRRTPAGHLVHQAARLERGRHELAIAVLTDGSPHHLYGRETVRGIAERLLR